MKKVNLVKLSITLITVFIVLVLLLALFLPMLVTWYVEKAHRHENLVTTIMVTCYPCAPFTVLSLLYLRKVLKNFLNKDFYNQSNIKSLKYMAICCIIISVITLIAGRFYLPFFIVAATFLFLSLLIFTLRSLFIEIKDDKKLNPES